jgi:hypothetical protein
VDVGRDLCLFKTLAAGIRVTRTLRFPSAMFPPLIVQVILPERHAVVPVSHGAAPVSPWTDDARIEEVFLVSVRPRRPRVELRLRWLTGDLSSWPVFGHLPGCPVDLQRRHPALRTVRWFLVSTRRSMSSIREDRAWRSASLTWPETPRRRPFFARPVHDSIAQRRPGTSASARTG